MKTCHDRTCGNYRPGQPYRKGRDCPRCWNAANRLGKLIPSAAPATAKPRLPLGVKSRAVAKYLYPCQHRGDVIGSAICAEGCGKGSVTKDVHACSLHGRCTVGVRAVGVDHCCRDCPNREEPTNGTITLPVLRSFADSRGVSRTPPLRHVPNGVRDRVQSKTQKLDALPPSRRTRVSGLDGHFNAGLIARPDGSLLLASRDRLHGARVHLASLTPDDDGYHAEHLATLDLTAPGCESGQADPRLHYYRGRLHVAFYGSAVWGGREHQKQFYAEVNDLLSPGPVFRPVAPNEGDYEKNWSFFEHAGQQYAVQWIAPEHVVLRIDGSHVREVYRTPNPFPWSGGERRGGAPPVHRNGEFVSFFHGRLGDGVDAVYSVGVYAFEDKPPFRVTRQSVSPLLWARDADRQPANGCRVVFPQGAIERDGKWLVSMGAGDHRIEIAEWDAAAVEGVLLSRRQVLDGPAPARPWPKSWSADPTVIKAYQEAANTFIANMPSAPDFSGRGVVIAAGGPYWASCYVTIRMLRHVGCELPVEVWYLGEKERDERYERLLSPYGVTFHDIEAHPARASRRIVRGFGTKLFAVVNSRFEEVLSLDPDSYPVADPTSLFEDSQYRRLGGIYWPDLDFTDGWTKWKIWGCEARGPCGLETGQFVIHKGLAWEPLKLAEWYDDHADFYYGSPPSNPGADYGDKGPHRAAWAKLRRDYVLYATAATRVAGIAYVQRGPSGEPMFAHRCQSKFTVEPMHFATTPQHGENIRGGLPGEEAAFGFLAELKERLDQHGIRRTSAPPA